MATSPPVEREKNTAFPSNPPTRSPYSTAGNPVTEFTGAVKNAVDSLPPTSVARAPDGSLAGPGLTPYAPYRMGPQPKAPAAAAPAAAAMAAPPREPIPSVGTMPLEPEVQGANVNPLAGAAAALSGSLSRAFPEGKQAFMDAGNAAQAAAAQGNYGAAVGQSLRGAVVAPVMAAGDVLSGVAGDLATIARPVAQTVYTAATGDSSPIWQGNDDPRSQQGDTARTPNPASDQGGGKPPAAAAAQSGAKPPAGTTAATAPAKTASPPAAEAMATGPGAVNVRRQPNGVLEFSGENVAGPVSYNGAQAAGFRPSGAGVSVVPGMAPGEAQAILNRPFDVTGGMNAAQRAQYLDEVRTAQAINANTLAQGTGRIGDYIRSGQARRALNNENTASTIAARGQEMQSRAAADVLAERRQTESEANSDVTRRTGEVQLASAEQIQALQNEAINGKTPEARAEAAKTLAALSGKQQQNRYTVIPGGQEFDRDAGAVLTRQAMVLDNSTGRLVNLSGATPGTEQGAAPVTPPPDAVTFLRDKGRDDPAVVAAFDEKYGPGAAARYLR